MWPGVILAVCVLGGDGVCVGEIIVADIVEGCDKQRLVLCL